MAVNYGFFVKVFDFKFWSISNIWTKGLPPRITLWSKMSQKKSIRKWKFSSHVSLYTIYTATIAFWWIQCLSRHKFIKLQISVKKIDAIQNWISKERDFSCGEKKKSKSIRRWKSFCLLCRLHFLSNLYFFKFILLERRCISLGFWSAFSFGVESNENSLWVCWRCNELQ